MPQRTKRKGEKKMALGIYSIWFVVVCAIGVVSLLLLFLSKSERLKKGVFYFIVVYGVLISLVGITSEPSNFVISRMFFGAMGVMSIVGFIMHIRAVSKAQYTAAYVVIAVSVVASILKLFIF